MIFNFRKKDRAIENKEAEIQELNITLHKRIDKDRQTLGKINKVLGNGITLKIYQATHGDSHAK